MLRPVAAVFKVAARSILKVVRLGPGRQGDRNRLGLDLRLQGGRVPSGGFRARRQHG